jgi:hypothetical protein
MFLRRVRTLLRRYLGGGIQCEARIWVSFDREEPRGRQCARAADEPVCGVWLCWQHREVVTTWADGAERLSPGAEKEFAAWGVTASAPFEALA